MTAYFALALLPALAQDVAPKAELKLDKATAVVGQAVKGKVTVSFAEGLHAYQNPPVGEYEIPLKIEAAKGTTLVKAVYPKGEDFLMSGATAPTKVYKDKVEIPVILKAPSKAGKQTLKLSVNYQQCNDSACFPPGKVDITGTLTVSAPAKKG
jgi:DsbC/DsbD-like thiol-disulfide interchange protein